MGYHGGECALTASTFESYISARSTLSIGLLATTRLQDPTADVIQSRAAYTETILHDISQADEVTVFNCMQVLNTGITQNPSTAGSTRAINSAVAVFSKILASGSDDALASATRANITNALAALMIGVQSNLAVGQTGLSWSTPVVRIVTSTTVPSSLASVTFSPPRSATEIFLTRPTPIVTVNATGSSYASIGVSILEYSMDPRKAVTVSSIAAVQLVGNSLNRQQKQEEESDAALYMTMYFPNDKPAIYYSTWSPAISGSVNCTYRAESSSYTVDCLACFSVRSAVQPPNARIHQLHLPASEDSTSLRSLRWHRIYTNPSLLRNFLLSTQHNMPVLNVSSHYRRTI